MFDIVPLGHRSGAVSVAPTVLGVAGGSTAQSSLHREVASVIRYGRAVARARRPLRRPLRTVSHLGHRREELAALSSLSSPFFPQQRLCSIPRARTLIHRPSADICAQNDHSPLALAAGVQHFLVCKDKNMCNPLECPTSCCVEREVPLDNKGPNRFDLRVDPELIIGKVRELVAKHYRNGRMIPDMDM